VGIVKASFVFKALAVAGFLMFLAVTHRTKFDYFKEAAQAQGLQPMLSCQPVKLNDRRHFYTKGLSGWERTFRWTDGASSYIFFVMPKAWTGHKLRIRLNGSLVVADFIRIRMRGVRSDGSHLKRGKARNAIFVTEPLHLRSDKLVALEMDIDNPRRGSLQDKRWLGVAVSSLTVCPIAEDAS
jgi:hypothetical protein